MSDTTFIMASLKCDLSMHRNNECIVTLALAAVQADQVLDFMLKQVSCSELSAALQACTAAVQTTHTLRMVAALLFAILLRVAKTVIYGGHQLVLWQQPLLHLYDVPPVVLLSIVQLSAIGIVAKQFKTVPSLIPQAVSSVLAFKLVCTVMYISDSKLPCADGLWHKFCTLWLILQCNQMYTAENAYGCAQKSIMQILAATVCLFVGVETG